MSLADLCVVEEVLVGRNLTFLKSHLVSVSSTMLEGFLGSGYQKKLPPGSQFWNDISKQSVNSPWSHCMNNCLMTKVFAMALHMSGIVILLLFCS